MDHTKYLSDLPLDVVPTLTQRAWQVKVFTFSLCSVLLWHWLPFKVVTPKEHLSVHSHYSYDYDIAITSLKLQFLVTVSSHLKYLFFWNIGGILVLLPTFTDRLYYSVGVLLCHN